MKVEWFDGAVYEAETAQELVEAMKLDNPAGPEPTKAKYMEGVAERTPVVFGQELHYTTPEEFIAELERVGALKVLEV